MTSNERTSNTEIVTSKKTHTHVHREYKSNWYIRKLGRFDEQSFFNTYVKWHSFLRCFREMIISKLSRFVWSPCFQSCRVYSRWKYLKSFFFGRKKKIVELLLYFYINPYTNFSTYWLLEWKKYSIATDKILKRRKTVLLHLIHWLSRMVQKSNRFILIF